MVYFRNGNWRKLALKNSGQHREFTVSYHHRFGRWIYGPDASPLDVKLETYLRAARGVEYEFLNTGPASNAGKRPRMYHKGNYIDDSQLCVEYLEREFGSLVANLTKEQILVSHAVRKMLEESTYFLNVRYGNIDIFQHY